MERTTASRAELFGGGPADGERRTAREGETTIVVALHETDAAVPGGVRSGHLYERQPDGRFRYAGIGTPPPVLPAPSHADEHALLLAALGHERGPHPAAIILVLAVVVGAMYAFSIYA